MDRCSCRCDQDLCAVCIVWSCDCAVRVEEYEPRGEDTEEGYVGTEQTGWRENGTVLSPPGLPEPDSVGLEVGVRPLAASMKDSRACHRSPGIQEEVTSNSICPIVSGHCHSHWTALTASMLAPRPDFSHQQEGNGDSAICVELPLCVRA